MVPFKILGMSPTKCCSFVVIVRGSAYVTVELEIHSFGAILILSLRHLISSTFVHFIYDFDCSLLPAILRSPDIE